MLVDTFSKKTTFIFLEKHRQILNRVRLGDTQAFEELYQMFWEELLDSALRVLKDRANAEDIVQEIFISLWRKRESIQIKDIKAYLYSSVRYKVISHIRKEKISLSVFELTEQFHPYQNSTEEQADFRETRQIIETTIAKLPSKCQSVFRMSRFDHMSNKEIAEQLGLSVRTVDSHISNAINFLRANMKEVVILLYSIFLGNV